MEFSLRFIDTVLNLSNVTFLKSVAHINDLPQTSFPEVAFAGRSNAGKSSLLNRLFQRKSLVKTSSKPGHTQLLNFFEVDTQAYFVDMPGYGFAMAPEAVQRNWQRLLDDYVRVRECLRLVVCIFDIRRRLDHLDMALLDFLRSCERDVFVVLNKADKLNARELARQRHVLEEALRLQKDKVFVVSCLTGKGIDVLRERLCNVL